MSWPVMAKASPACGLWDKNILEARCREAENVRGLMKGRSKGHQKFSVNLAEVREGIMEYPKLPVFQTTKRWLDLYFRGEIPDFTPRGRGEYIYLYSKI